MPVSQPLLIAGDHIEIGTRQIALELVVRFEHYAGITGKGAFAELAETIG